MEPLLVEKPQTIQAPFWEFSVDWPDAECSIHPFEGIVYVEMAPYEEKRSGLLLTDESQRRMRADVAVVLAVGPDRTEPFMTGSGYEEEPLPLEVYPGDKVLVEPYRGDCFSGFSAGSYRAKGVVRVYGDASCDEHRFRGRQIDECIFAIVEDKIGANIEVYQALKPVGRWVIVKRDPQPEARNGIYLPGREQIRPPFGVIVAASKLAMKHGRLPGQRVQYKQTCSHPMGIYELELGETDRDLAFVPYENITAVL